MFECVPNYSEGRDADKIEKIVDCFRGVKGVKLLDYSSDSDHNRSVVTVIGEREPLKAAVVASIGKALELIDGADGDTVDDVLFAAYSDPERKNKVDALNAGTYYPGATSVALSANYNILGVRDKNGNEWATFVIEKASATLALGDQTTAE